MTTAINKLNHLLTQGEAYFSSSDENYIRQPFKPGKWSRKQILGHSIDSALNNLTRFTEIGYQPQPYIYREYHQDELVAINDYQNMNTAELVALWLSLNRQIVRIMTSATNERLALNVRFPDGSLENLRFIMTDYPEHMDHHMSQILSE